MITEKPDSNRQEESLDKKMSVDTQNDKPDTNNVPETPDRLNFDQSSSLICDIKDSKPDRSNQNSARNINNNEIR